MVLSELLACLVKRTLFAGITLVSVSQLATAAVNYPFPQATDHYGIKPNVAQSAMNTHIASAYDDWKSKYLRAANNTVGGYYVYGPDTDGEGKGTSESHGYGMLVTVLMAGYDTNAQLYFDGLWSFFNTHRSSINNELMGWFIDWDESSGTHDSAADGDMDIAYALLLADKQWGSNGTINYKQEAVDMINYGLRIGILDISSMRIMRGDWDDDPLSTRSSDWMTGHLRAFHDATGDSVWLSAADAIYVMVDQIVTSHSSNTGLMPDFVTGNPATPSNADTTGEANSGAYYYNAARTPWRLAADYLHHGITDSKDISNRLVTWASTIVGPSYNFDNYLAGYNLNGNPLEEDENQQWSDITFVAPLVVAASVSSEHQSFLDAGWEYITQTNFYPTYFSDSINLLSKLMISGNWWPPVTDRSPITDSVCSDQTDSNGDGFGDACVPPDTVIRPGVSIGSNPVIGLGTVIRKDATIGDNVTLGMSVIIARNSTLGDNVSIGDLTRIRKDAQVGNNVIIGDNVTVAKNSQIGDDVQIGNGTIIRKNVFIGAGAIVGNNVTIRKVSTILPGVTVPDGTVVPKNTAVPLTFIPISSD
ncbi:MAG: chitosanase [Gammaproteobacteria bacterium]|nr:chitosanase [Gammaproteobacteria bacterium]